MRAALCGIEAVARALNLQHDRLTMAQVDELTGALVAEARRLQSMLAQRVEATTVFDLAEAIRPVLACARSCGLEVRAAVPSGLRVQGRADDTAQAVYSLLDNARKHAAPSAVDVRATVRGGTTTLYVEDRGRGLDRDIDQRCFESGVRGERSSGSGLGLFIARRLIVGQGGSLAVGRRQGGGSSFAVSLRTAPSSAHQRMFAIPVVCAVPA
jgi:signal transduction histidine kinase